MRLTAEVRWFWEGAPPATFQEWFTGGGPNWAAIPDSQLRTDQYLFDPVQWTLGIKKRGGQDTLEIKGFVAPGKTTVEIAGCASVVGLWVKWPTGALTLTRAAVIHVQKRRWMRKFRVSAGAVSDCTGSDPLRTTGCDAELTLITVRNSAWWTLGFEAFGELESVEGDLAATAAVLASRNPPVLPRGEASSYPRWLASLPKA
jgi:hypothetical protein